MIGATVVLLLAPLFLGRMFFPQATLKLFHRCGKIFSKILSPIDPELDLNLLVKAANRLFRDRFAKTPYGKRILLLPFCLRPLDCPADVHPEEGLLCDSSCENCAVGEIRTEALDLGYAKVYVVPSSRIMRNRGLSRSDQFIKRKIKEHGPGGALGVTCGWHLRNRLLAKHSFKREGYGEEGKPKSVIQGLLLEGRNCKQAQVDWQELREMMRRCA